jgi:hypothetical protein
MQLTPTIYNQYKKVADEAYMDMYHAILAQVEEENPTLTEDQHDALTLDIMLSNVLGTVTSFDHVHACLKYDIEERDNLAYENKNMALALEKLNYTQEQISDICNGAI